MAQVASTAEVKSPYNKEGRYEKYLPHRILLYLRIDRCSRLIYTPSLMSTPGKPHSSLKLMPGILEASDVVLRYAVGIVRVLRLTACIVRVCVGEATGIEPVRDERPRGKDRLATLIWLPLCSRVCRKSLRE